MRHPGRATVHRFASRQVDCTNLDKINTITHLSALPIKACLHHGPSQFSLSPKMAYLRIFTLAVVVLLGLAQLPAEATKSPKTVCYYESWVHWRTGAGFLDPSELDSSLCTHSVYAYFGIDPATNGVKILDDWLMVNLREYP